MLLVTCSPGTGWTSTSMVTVPAGGAGTSGIATAWVSPAPMLLIVWSTLVAAFDGDRDGDRVLGRFALVLDFDFDFGRFFAEADGGGRVGDERGSVEARAEQAEAVHARRFRRRRR